MESISISSPLYVDFQKALRQAIHSITEEGIAFVTGHPERFPNTTGKPFATYLPALARDLQTSDFQSLLGVTRQMFAGQPENCSPESLELARLRIFQILQDASTFTDWSHPARVARIAVAMGVELGWPQERLLHLYWGALLHDVGKIFVEELAYKLNKLGFDDSSIIFPIVRTHAELGGMFIQTAQFLFPCGGLCASQHQESMDGSGYPVGLSYPQIAKEGIITNLADGYDATVTRTGWSAAQVRQVEQEFYRTAGYPNAPELLALLSVIDQYHTLWYSAA